MDLEGALQPGPEGGREGNAIWEVQAGCARTTRLESPPWVGRGRRGDPLERYSEGRSKFRRGFGAEIREKMLAPDLPAVAGPRRELNFLMKQKWALDGGAGVGQIRTSESQALPILLTWPQEGPKIAQRAAETT